MHFGVIFFLLFCCLLKETTPQNERTIMDNLNSFVRSAIYTLFGRTGNLQRMRNARKLGTRFDDNMEFPCKKPPSYRSETRPNSVHELRAGDIDVVAAIGDSLTAANGAAASAAYHIAVENRGLSWAIGGQGTWRKFLTLPNILKEFNPNLVGYSTGDGAAIFRESQFNVAEGGSMSRDMPYMAKVLVKRIKADKRVNFFEDWKLVTFMIGANDFCADICYHHDPWSTAEAHRRNMVKTLDYLRDNLPRTIVNVVVPPNIDILMKFTGKSMYCSMMQVFSCPCIFGKANDGKRDKLVPVMRRWQEIDEEVCMDPRYRKTDDFAVVLQPFIADLTFPEKPTSLGNTTDWSFLSEDCFHFSQKGYARAAYALWTNLLEPVGRKSTDWRDVSENIPCPSQSSPYIFTWKNSGYSIETRQVLPR